MLYWDKGRRSLALALRSLWLHKLRAFLSVLGIIIGTGAVIALMAFGEGSMQDALDDIRKLGATNIIVRSVKPPENSATGSRSRVAIYGLTQGDYERFAVLEEGGTVTRMVPMRIFPQEIRRLAACLQRPRRRHDAGYAQVNELPMALGRFLRDEDDDQGAQRRRARLPTSPRRCSPSRTRSARPSASTSICTSSSASCATARRWAIPAAPAAEDFNNDVYIPLSTCNARFGETIIYPPGRLAAARAGGAQPGHADGQRHRQGAADRRVDQVDPVAARSNRTGW